LVENPEERRPVGRFRCQMEHNIEMHLKEVRWKGVGSIYVTESRIY